MSTNPTLLRDLKVGDYFWIRRHYGVYPTALMILVEHHRRYSSMKRARPSGRISEIPFYWLKDQPVIKPNIKPTGAQSMSSSLIKHAKSEIHTFYAVSKQSADRLIARVEALEAAICIHARDNANLDVYDCVEGREDQFAIEWFIGENTDG